MLVYIDAASNQKTTIGVDGYRLIRVYDYPRDQKILEAIAELLKKKKIAPQKISEIKINLGPGSYTSLRVSCAVANTLAWALGIKVNGKKQVIPVYGQW